MVLNDQKMIIVSITSWYVDDLMIVGCERIERVKIFLSTKFRMKNMGCEKLTNFGNSMNQNSENFLINKTDHLLSVLKKNLT